MARHIQREAGNSIAQPESVLSRWQAESGTLARPNSYSNFSTQWCPRALWGIVHANKYLEDFSVSRPGHCCSDSLPCLLNVIGVQDREEHTDTK